MQTRFPDLAFRHRGALMGVALLLLLCSGLFLAGWATIMNTRAIQVSWLEEAVQRRISLENSRALSWQTALDHGYGNSARLASATYLLQNGEAGGVDTGDGWQDPPLFTTTEATTVTPFNQTGLRPGSMFFVAEKFRRPAGLTVDAFTAHLFLKSRCPASNGDLFVVYRKPDRYPASSVLDVYKTTSAFLVEGRVVVKHPPSLFALNTPSVNLPMHCRSLYLQAHDANGDYPVTGTSLAGARMLPSNVPAVPSTTGQGSEGQTVREMFAGRLNVIRNNAHPQNSLWHVMGTQGTDTVQAYTDNLPPEAGYWMEKYYAKPPIPPPDFEKGGYDVPYKTLYLRPHVMTRHLRIICEGPVADQIVIEGQAASDYEAAGRMSPLIITFMQGAGAPLRNIVFKGENNRRLIFGIQKLSSLNSSSQPFSDGEVVFTWAGDPLEGRQLRWRMTLINEGHNILLNLHNNAAYDVLWLGGVMTNWSFRRNHSNTGPRVERLTFRQDSFLPVAEGDAAATAYHALLPREAWLESYFLPD